MAANIVIALESKKSAEYLKQEIEKDYLLLDGKVKIIISNEVKPLSEIIKEQK